VAGCAGEPLALKQVFHEAPELAEGITFLGVWIPGVNRTDWAAFSPSSRAETIFMSADLRDSFKTGRTRFLPLSYSQAVRWLGSCELDGAVVMTAPPTGGRASLGIAADFSPVVLERKDVPVLALANARMPPVRDGIGADEERFSSIVSIDHPLVTVPDEMPPEDLQAVAREVASLVEDGDTLQFGLGRFQGAVLEALAKKRDLAIHSGMISGPVADLLGKGVLREEGDPVTTGVALGSEDFYARVADTASIRYRSVAFTHAASTLMAIPSFKAINAAVEVDLFGQVNGEFLGGRQVSGTGGMVDFSRGAGLSPGGASITALTSTAKNGAISRIVPRLGGPATSLARHEAGIVVTEYGSADLRLRTIDQRAEALIGIAHPSHRESLTRAFEELTRSL
jgi:acyl-CoA hydrolase